MNLTDYLKSEGVIDLSRDKRDPLKRHLTPKQLKEHQALVDQAMFTRSAKDMGTVYDFFEEHNLGKEMESLEYGRIIATAPKILAELTGSKQVLEIGGNSGLKTVFYAINLPETHFKSIDLSSLSTNRARDRANRYGATNIEFQTQEMSTLEEKEKYDRIFSEFALHELASIYFAGRERIENPRYDQKFAKAHSLLKKGKFIVIVHPNRYNEILDDFQWAAKKAGFSNYRDQKIRFICRRKPKTGILFVAEKE